MPLHEISASLQIGFPVLSVLIALPLIGMVVVVLSPSDRLAQAAAVGSSLLALLLCLVMLGSFQMGSADFQFVEHWGGIVRLGIDGVSALFLPLTALLTLLACLSGEASNRAPRRYLALILALSATLTAAFSSADVFLFWMFMTLELVPVYLLVSGFGTGNERRAAAQHFAAMMVIASALLLIGLDMLVSEGGGSAFVTLINAEIAVDTQASIFVLICLGLAIKAPIFPLHSWLPRVLDQGPVVGCGVFLVGVKIGTYGLLRLVIPMLPEASAEWFWVLAGLGAIGMVYGALIALIQTNLRKLLAFASVSHMGVVLLGIFSLNLYGLQGGLLQMMSIGLAVAGLYFIAGFLYERIGPPEIRNLGGLVQSAPLLSLGFLVLVLAAIGLPGTSGFNGEHLVVIGAYKVHAGMALMVGLGTVLTAAYLLRYFSKAFMADAAESRRIVDLDLKERVIVIALTGMVLFSGLYTSPFLNIATGSLQAVAHQVEARTVVADEPLLLISRDARMSEAPALPGKEH